MNKNKLNKFIYIFFREIFFISLVLLLVLLFLEDFNPGFVFLWFRIENLLIIVFVTGILSLFTSRPKNDKIKK